MQPNGNHARLFDKRTDFQQAYTKKPFGIATALCAQQPNGDDCGVHVCRNAEVLRDNNPLIMIIIHAARVGSFIGLTCINVRQYKETIASGHL